MPQSLTFGLFPLGLAGSPDGVAAGPPDDVDQIVRAVQYLQGDGPPAAGPDVRELDRAALGAGRLTARTLLEAAGAG